MRARSLAWLALALALAAPAQAHMGEEDPPAGTLTVPAGGSVAIALQSVHPGDHLEWVWTPAGDASGVQAQVRWLDAAGEERAEPATPAGQRYGRFDAPPGAGASRLVFTNAGAADATVDWTYQSSTDFWSRPDMVLPAVVPFVALAGALAAGKVLDAHFKRRRARVRAAGGQAAAEATPALILTRGDSR